MCKQAQANKSGAKFNFQKTKFTIHKKAFKSLN